MVKEISRRHVLVALTTAPLVTAMPALATGKEHDLIFRLSLDGSPGLAAGVVRHGHVVAAGGKGLAFDSSYKAPDENTVFEIGSLTKTFTASLIFQLQEEGRLHIEAALGDFLADLPAAWRALPLSMLLSHTSGLPEYLNAGNFRMLMPQALQPTQIVSLVADQALRSVPGTKHEYCNTGFILLGMVAEAVTRSSYWDELHRRFFIPADMRSTGPRDRLRHLSRLASGRFWSGDAWDEHPPVSAPGSTWAAGGLLSTASDMNRWSIALDRGQILSSEVRRNMWKPATLANGTPAGWGYGWLVEAEGARTIVSHGGGTAGFSCWYRRDVSAELSTIVLTNQNGRADPKTMTDALLASMGKSSRRHKPPIARPELGRTES